MRSKQGSMWRGEAVGVIAAVLTCGAHAVADTICVPDDYETIQAAIDAAMDGDEICVAPGTYNEAIDFLGKAVRLFSTHGPDVTIIDAGLPAPPMAVVTCWSGEGPETRLEGFTVQRGTGNPWPEDPEWNIGGGMCILSASPTVVDCHFTLNTSDFGGGMYVQDGGPTVTECAFTENTTHSGAGVSNSFGSTAVLTGCRFENNTADAGGGVENWESDPTIMNCVFLGNLADEIAGGGIYNYFSNPTVINCTLIDNACVAVGGGMYNGGSNPIVESCTFSGNEATDGGGMFSNLSSPTVTNCTFSENSASGGGGGMWNVNSSPTVTRCTFTANSAVDGGAVHCEASDGSWSHTLFFANTATLVAGAVRTVNGSQPEFINSTFEANEARVGGGMHNDASSPRAIGCLFIENRATKHGAAMYNAGGSGPVLANVTLAMNEAVRNAGGIFNVDASDAPTLVGSILYHNTDQNGTGELSQMLGGTPIVHYSCIEGWTGGLGGVGNTGADPQFVDPLNGDCRLLTGSPCIDAAANNALPADVLDLDDDGDTAERLPLDLDGSPRFADDPDTEGSGCGEPVIADMGPYEYQGVPVHPVLVGDVDGDGVVNFTDILDVLAAWGDCDPECCLADQDFNWTVEFADILLILANWS